MSKAKVRKDKYGFIKQIGVELEGRWDESPELNGLGSFYEDGSVEVDCDECCSGGHRHDEDCYDGHDLVCDYYEDNGCSCCVGEIGSKPMSFQEIYEFMDKYYPDKTNNTCGIHYHVSFNSRLSYMQLMSKSFYDYFLQRCEKWGKYMGIREGSSFWERLAGNNHYCERKFQPHLQCHTTDKSDNRYCQLNFCYPLYNTLECRLFPAFQNKKYALSSLELFVDICNSWLKRKHTNRSYSSIIMDDDKIEKRIEEIICVL